MWSSGFSFGLRVNRHCCLTAAVVAVTLAAFLAIWLSALPRVCALPLGIIAGLQGRTDDSRRMLGNVNSLNQNLDAVVSDALKEVTDRNRGK